MKYLKYFKKASEYTEYKSSSDYVTPNVSYVVEGDFVDYNAYVIEKIIMQVGNKYPDVAARFTPMINKYAQPAANNIINEIVNDPESPEHLKNWRCDVYLNNASIDTNDEQDGYVLEFYINLGFFDPSVDPDNFDWEDPSMEGKFLEFSDIPVRLSLSSEDVDFIKSIRLDEHDENSFITSIIFTYNDYDENGNWVGNPGVFRELENVRFYIHTWYNLGSYDGYTLTCEPQPA